MASRTQNLAEPQWYALQTLSNMEGKVKRYLDKFIELEEMGEFVLDVLMPTETVTETKNGRKTTKQRKFYPGYVFIHMRLYDEEAKILQKPWYFVRGVEGVIGFIGGDRPTPLKKDEIDGILQKVQEAEGKEVPKVTYSVGEEVKITDGPFLNLTGKVEDVNNEANTLKVSVAMFGRFTEVTLEFWQVERAGEE